MFWNELIMAYEADVAALEAARRTYGGAVEKLMNRLASTIAAERPEASTVVLGRSVEILSPSAPQLQLRRADDLAVPFVTSVWVASIFGGPPGVLRVGVWLDTMPGAVFKKNLPLAIDVARASLPASAPGEAFDAEKHRDADPSLQWLRIVTLLLTERSIEAIERDVVDQIASMEREAIAPAAARLRPWADKLRDLEALLVASYSVVQRHATMTVGRVVTAREPLPVWQGMPYVQWDRPGGRMWLAVHAPSRSLLMQCDRALGSRLGELAGEGSPVLEVGGYPSIVVASAESLDTPEAERRIDALCERWGLGA